jgi:hypothetical protein
VSGITRREKRNGVLGEFCAEKGDASLEVSYAVLEIL